MNAHQIQSTDVYRVTAFAIVADYTIQLHFDDGSEQTINFEPILYGPVFGQLRDLALFEQVQLDEIFGTLEWPNGADIDPTVLHDWPHHVDAIVKRRRQHFAVPSRHLAR
jgi:hypothetical protein